MIKWKNGKSKTRKSRKYYSQFSILAVGPNQKLRFKNLGKKFPRFPRFLRFLSFRPDRIIIWCFALQLSFSHEKLYSRFHYFKPFISVDSWASKFTDLQKLILWYNLNYSNFFQVFVHIFEIHIIRKIYPKYMNPATSTAWDKNFLAICLS